MKKSILRRRRKRRVVRDFELQLTSMMDMLIILLVFLLKSYASNSTISTSAKIQLPVSSVQEVPAEAINLIVDSVGLTVDNEKVLDFKLPQGFSQEQLKDLKPEQATYEIEAGQLADSGRKILPLYDSLIKAKEKAELLMSKAVWKDENGKPKETPKFQGILIIHADKSIRYEMVRKIMYTAGSAEFKIFKLVAVRKET